MNAASHNFGLRVSRCGAGTLSIILFCALVTRSYSLPAPGPPRITNQPMSQTVVAGSNVSFTVGVAESSTPLSYQWLFSRDGISYVNIPGATDETHTMGNAQPTNEGKYKVNVSNASGSVMSSNAMLTVIVPPRITQQPQSANAALCSDVIFSVTATGTGPLRYQWSFHGNPVSKATNAMLLLNNVSRSDEGNYHVVVSNSVGTATSSNATLILYSSGGGQIGPSAWRVPLGTMGSQVLNSGSSNSPPGISTPCGPLTENARWIRLVPEEDGLFVIDTIGSNFDTILGVFKGENFFDLMYVGCDSNGAPDGVRSKVKFDAGHCQNYFVAIDGVNGQQGTAQINWKLGKAPMITQQPQSQTVPAGSNVSFSIEAFGVPAPSFQWRFNGADMPGATNTIWTLDNAQPTNAGSYSVIAYNFIEAVPSQEAILVVQPIVRLTALGIAPDGFHLRLTGPNGTYTIEASDQLAGWFPITTVSTSDGMVEVVDPDAFFFQQRFYRATSP